MIVLLIVAIATLVAGIIAAVSKDKQVHERFLELYWWGVCLIGSAITVIVIINAVWIGFRTCGLLK
jgi:hypothetical protein